MREPFNLSIAEIRKLTLHQISYIYMHETDQEGQIVPMMVGDDVERDEKQEQIDKWRLYHGLSQKEGEVWWREKLECDAWRDDWGRRTIAEIEDAARRYREEQFTAGLRGEALEIAVMAFKGQRLIENDERLKVDLAAFRAGQVKRRKFRGRVW